MVDGEDLDSAVTPWQLFLTIFFISLQSLLHSLLKCFILDSFVHFFSWLNRSFIFHSFIHSFVHSFLDSVIHSFIKSFINSDNYSMFGWLACSTYSFMYLSIHVINGFINESSIFCVVCCFVVDHNAAWVLSLHTPTIGIKLNYIIDTDHNEPPHLYTNYQTLKIEMTYYFMK